MVAQSYQLDELLLLGNQSKLTMTPLISYKATLGIVAYSIPFISPIVIVTAKPLADPEKS